MDDKIIIMDSASQSINCDCNSASRQSALLYCTVTL